jgi:lipopolysaccharide export LptBFGC system permease protein LptF
VGLAIGATLGVSGRPRSSRLVVIILLLALGGSAVSFANIAWLTPASNQLYREEAIGRPVPRGDGELTLSELQSSAGLFSNPRSFLYHARVVLAVAPLTFVVFGLVIATRRLTRTAAVMSVSAALICCEGGLIWGAVFTANGVLPGPIAAWLPQAALIATTILVSVFVRSNRAPITRTLV